MKFHIPLKYNKKNNIYNKNALGIKYLLLYNIYCLLINIVIGNKVLVNPFDIWICPIGWRNVEDI